MAQLTRAAAIAAVLLLVPGFAGGAVAADPTMQHTIDSHHADAHFTVTDRCLRTEVWISATTGAWSLPPGPPSRTPIATIDVTTFNDCPARPTEVAAGGGGGGTIVFDATSETTDRLDVHANLTGARLVATVPLVDRLSGRTLVLALDLTWRPLGAVAHWTWRNVVHVRAVGMLSGHENDWLGDATVTGSIRLAGHELIAGMTGAGHLERTKWHCVENRDPAYTGAGGWCLWGF